jgi:HEAT repeat protein
MNENLSTQQFLENIKSADEAVRADAWMNAAAMGPEVLAPLAALVTHQPLEVTRAAKRAMWKIVHAAGAPGAANRKETSAQLVVIVTGDYPDEVRREVMWMISEISDSEAVEPVAAFLQREPLREDARLVLQRIPGRQAVSALQAAFEKAPESFKFALAESLRDRGVDVEGYPSQKLVPKKATHVSEYLSRQ